MYRDSQLGLCVDLTGPEGNVFALLGLGDDLAAQLNQQEDWKLAIKATQIMGGSYMSHVYMFQQFFPMVTLVGLEGIAHAHRCKDGSCDCEVG